MIAFGKDIVILRIITSFYNPFETTFIKKEQRRNGSNTVLFMYVPDGINIRNENCNIFFCDFTEAVISALTLFVTFLIEQKEGLLRAPYLFLKLIV